MTSLLILAAYALLGALCALLVLLRPARLAVGLGRWTKALLAFALWPFLLPTLGGAPGPRGGTPASARGRRLDEVCGRLQEAWRRAGRAAGANGQERERGVLDGFVARLRDREARLVEMERTLESAPPSVRERLVRLRESAVAELEQGIALLDELAAQLTLLQYADLAAQGGARLERDHVVELLARIEALAEVSTA